MDLKRWAYGALFLACSCSDQEPDSKHDSRTSSDENLAKTGPERDAAAERDALAQYEDARAKWALLRPEPPLSGLASNT